MFANLPAAAALLLLPLATASPVAPRAATDVPVSVTVDTHPEVATGTAYNWAEGWKADFPIHPSCNATLRNQLEAGLQETIQLAAHARDHLLRWGSESELARKYFGNASVAGPIGWYSRIVSSDKGAMLFRCDDPDRNCATQEAWAGHWRGDNATQETVICDLSYEIRRPLSAVCNLGYTVAESRLNTYWATDLLHRVLHVPLITDAQVEHYAETYADVLDLAKSDPAKSVLDSDALQYFAIDAWAYDIAAPGVGCPGKVPEAEAETTATATATETAAATTAAAAGAATSTDADHEHCHTHADGSLHCQ
ncbi:putative peptidase family-domain-containing protein [Plectosphaerella plurivora]|uniref:Peptidase family-domain-containing protein n=1 Tax=Plectosphaerella plurivora TaxID=936078 RepID=A0A9P9ADN5_9PEZI|nr:putative peptidase family-domain-containing protein [Plectosphaerella plurivora]